MPRWMKILLKDTVFEKDTILSVCKNLANGASTSKRDGHTMAGAVLRSMNTIKSNQIRFGLF